MLEAAVDSLSNPEYVPLPEATSSELDGPLFGSDWFHFFAKCPVEIRIKIWRAALTPRIIKCKHSNNQNIFTGPSTPITLLNVSKESRETAFLYGEYGLVSTSPSMVYFSPIVDYLWFDAGWTPLAPQEFQAQLLQPPPLRHDFSESLPAHLMNLQNIMVHPNWSDQRMKPTIKFAKFPRLARILVAADERSIGIQSQVMMDTIYDLKIYFAIAKKHDTKVKMPDIAVGCLGWTGADGRRLHHANEDNRQLVGIFENYGEMKDHQGKLREEEWRFTRDHFATPKPSIIAKLERARELSEKKMKLENPEDTKAPSESPRYENSDAERENMQSELPAYNDVVSTDLGANATSCVGDVRS